MFPEHKLICNFKSGFKPGQSRINYLLSISQNIYQFFSFDFETTEVFLDISKGFDKFWHESAIYKLKGNGISMVKTFKNGPSKVCQRQPLKNLKWYGLLTDHITSNFLKLSSTNFIWSNLKHLYTSSLSSVIRFLLSQIKIFGSTRHELLLKQEPTEHGTIGVHRPPPLKF